MLKKRTVSKNESRSSEMISAYISQNLRIAEVRRDLWKHKQMKIFYIRSPQNKHAYSTDTDGVLSLRNHKLIG